MTPRQRQIWLDDRERLFEAQTQRHLGPIDCDPERHQHGLPRDFDPVDPEGRGSIVDELVLREGADKLERPHSRDQHNAATVPMGKVASLNG